MINSLIESVLIMVKKPKILLPGIIFMLLDFIARYFFEEQSIEVLFKFLEFSSYPVVSLQKMPFQVIAGYPGDLMFLGFVLLISSVIGVMLSVSIANYLIEKKSVIGSIIFSIKNALKILVLVLFFGLMLLLSGIVLWIAMLFAVEGGILGAIILLLVILLMGFVLVHFAFVLTLIAKKLNIKQALKESWNFSSKHFFELILLLIGVMLINAVLSQIYLIVLNTAFGENELMVLVEMVFSLIILTYSNAVFPLYYLNKSK
ncbi:MAG: hypothetical protein ABH986_05115 [archaeon]